jgi:tape measure domain-containing protein
MSLEFYMRLREMVSGGLAKMADTARKTTSAIKGTNDTLAQSYDTIRGKIGQLEATIRSSTSLKQIREARMELEKLQRMSNNSPGNIGGGGGAGGVMALVRQYLGPMALGAGLLGIMGAGAKQEQDIVGLKTFLGEKGEKGAKEAYANIQKDAAATPFDTQSLLNVNRALITTGLSAESSRKDTMNLANAIAAVGGGNDELQRMAINLQQIKNVGKATAVDIKQFGFAGINIFQLLKDATGKTTAEVKEMDVTYELLAYAFEKAGKAGGIYAGALDAQSKTISGRYNTLTDVIKIGAADIGTALQPLTHGLLDIGFAIVNTVVPAFVGLVGWIKENSTWLGLLTVSLGAGALAYGAYMLVVNGAAIATTVMSGAMAALNFVMSLNPVGLVIAGIAALVVGIIYAWNKFEGFRGVLLGVWEIAKLVSGVFIGLGKVLIGGLTFNPALMKEGIVQLADTATQISNGGISKAFNAGYAKRNDGRATATDAATPGGGALTNAISPTAPAAGANGTAAGITSGGPRVVNITVEKMADISVHAATVKEGLTEIKADVEEIFLRILYSGASTQ